MLKHHAAAIWMTLGFSVFAGFSMWSAYCLGGRMEGWLDGPVPWWEQEPLIRDTGNVLCTPAWVGIEAIPKYSCTSTWHPVYKVGMVTLWAGYTGAFGTISLMASIALRRRREMPFPS